MSDKPRRWFQVHLSTAVVMMFVAGGLLFLNLAPQTEGKVLSYGFPLEAVSPTAAMVETLQQLKYSWLIVINGTAVCPQLVFANILACTVILFIVGFACEWPIRRREARKP